MMKQSRVTTIVAPGFLLTACHVAHAQATGPAFAISKDNVGKPQKVYSPFANSDYPDRVYWGDTHVHTSYSWDAGLVGCTLGPNEAYRFAKGKRMIASSR